MSASPPPRSNGVFWEIFLKAVVPIAIISAAAMLIRHQVDLEVIKDTRFTNSDGRVLERQVQEGPKWLKESLAEIKLALGRLEERLRVVEQKIKK